MSTTQSMPAPEKVSADEWPLKTCCWCSFWQAPSTQNGFGGCLKIFETDESSLAYVEGQCMPALKTKRSFSCNQWQMRTQPPVHETFQATCFDEEKPTIVSRLWSVLKPNMIAYKCGKCGGEVRSKWLLRLPPIQQFVCWKCGVISSKSGRTEVVVVVPKEKRI